MFLLAVKWFVYLYIYIYIYIYMPSVMYLFLISPVCLFIKQKMKKNGQENSFRKSIIDGGLHNIVIQYPSII